MAYNPYKWRYIWVTGGGITPFQWRSNPTIGGIRGALPLPMAKKIEAELHHQREVFELRRRQVGLLCGVRLEGYEWMILFIYIYI